MPLLKVQDIEKHKTLAFAKVRPEPTKVLLAYPDYFEVMDVKNPYMSKYIGQTNKNLAFSQWKSLLGHYKALQEEGILEEIKILPGQPGLPDMVFCANQSFPWLSNGKKQVLLSNMAYTARQKEIVFFEQFFIDKGYTISRINAKHTIEGMGDLIPVPGSDIIFAGFGKRTSIEAIDTVSSMFKVPIIPLYLQSDFFYHLDTCFLPLDKDTVFFGANAFDLEGIKALNSFFKNLIEIPENEAISTFGLNAHIIHAPRNKTIAIIDQEAKMMIKLLSDQGVRVLKTDTSEFRKSGGSVFCMKMMYY